MTSTIINSSKPSISDLTPFEEIKKAFQRNFNSIKGNYEWFLADVAKDELWDTYINSFPLELRQWHTCNACRQFIKNYGGLVTIKEDLTIKSIWDFEAPSPFKEVISNLKTLIESRSVRDVFRTYELRLGIDSNRQTLESGTVIRWHHWSLIAPNTVLTSKSLINNHVSSYRDNKHVLKRSLEELNQEATETVLELISQKSIYRGEEFQGLLKQFLEYQKEYKTLSNETSKDNYCWTKYRQKALPRIRNSAIGTLLIDVSNGVDLIQAITKFENVMFGYKRPKGKASPLMIDQAKAQVIALGLENSLGRRHATERDLTVQDIVYVDRTSNLKGSEDLFEQVKKSLPTPAKKFDRVQEISLKDFIEKVIPTTESLEVLLENNHESNLVSLIAPTNMDAPSLFNWDNGFSWSYNGAIADSLSARVKKAGGKTEGELRCSLEWYNFDDLDIHLFCPNKEHIYFSHKRSTTGGTLDVDMNAGGSHSREAVENIIFPSKNKMEEGVYDLRVHNYSKRESIDVGFRVEIECQNKLLSFEYPHVVKHNENVQVAKFEYSKQKGITILESLPSETVSKQLWNLKTNTFHKVKMALYSPNYWENSSHTGNKHFFLMLEGAKSEGPIRGFFNEFLKPELLSHKQAFEILGGAVKLEDEPNQLSGIGFSSTTQGSFTVKVTGKTSRVLKVIV